MHGRRIGIAQMQRVEIEHHPFEQRDRADHGDHKGPKDRLAATVQPGVERRGPGQPTRAAGTAGRIRISSAGSSVMLSAKATIMPRPAITPSSAMPV
jgi:hypothetical protein